MAIAVRADTDFQNAAASTKFRRAILSKIMRSGRGEFPDMDWAPGRPPSFTGEMIYPWMFEDYPGLRPLRDVAELLAREERWPDLYDPAQLARAHMTAVAGRVHLPKAEGSAAAVRSHNALP